MNSIELLLHEGKHIEKMHQLVLTMLLKQTSLAKHLFGKMVKTDNSGDGLVVMEPNGGLFDIKAELTKGIAFVELKMWAALSDWQKQRQKSFITEVQTNPSLFYIIFGTEWFRQSAEQIKADFEGRASLLGYTEVVEALKKTLEDKAMPQNVRQIASAYCQMLDKDRNWMFVDKVVGDEFNWLRYYRAYHKLRAELQLNGAKIYETNRRRRYILSDWEGGCCVVHNGIKVRLFIEFDNCTLYVKMYAGEIATETKRNIREDIRNQHRRIQAEYSVEYKGSIRKKPTIFSVQHDFSDLENINESLILYRTVDKHIRSIAKELDRVRS